MYAEKPERNHIRTTDDAIPSDANISDAVRVDVSTADARRELADQQDSNESRCDYSRCSERRCEYSRSSYPFRTNLYCFCRAFKSLIDAVKVGLFHNTCLLNAPALS